MSLYTRVQDGLVLAVALVLGAMPGWSQTPVPAEIFPGTYADEPRPGLPAGLPDLDEVYERAKELPAIRAKLPGGLPEVPAHLEVLLKGLLDANPLNGYRAGSPELGGALPALWGELLPPVSGDPVRTISTFITRFGPLFGVPLDPTLLTDLGRLGKIAREGEDRVTLTPELEGIPYLPGQLTFHFGQAGGLTGVFGRFLAPRNVTKGQLDSNSAIEKAMQLVSGRVPGATFSGGGRVDEFLSDAPDGSVEHMYLVELSVGKRLDLWRAILGHDGEPLWVEDASQHAVPDGTVLPTYPYDARYPDPYLRTVNLARLSLPASQFHDWKLEGTDLQNHTPMFWTSSRDGHFSYPVYTSRSMGNQRVGNPDFLNTNVYHHLTAAIDWSRHWGMDRWKDRPIKYNVSVWPDPKDPITTDNAFYNPNEFFIGFDFVNQRLLESPALDASVIYHEFGHAVHDILKPRWWFHPQASWSQAARNQSNEAVAVSEGIGDTLAFLITDSPIVGGVCNPPQMRRDARNRLHLSWVTPCWIANPPPGATWFQEVHFAGTLLSGAYWEIMQNFGKEIAGRLLMGAIKQSQTPTTFLNMAVATLMADMSLHGGQHIPCLQAIFERRGILFGTPDPLACRH